MPHHEPHAHDTESVEQVTPFDEATDLLEEEDIEHRDDDLIRIERIAVPPAKTLVVFAGILLSPLFALVFGLNAALFMMVLAMAFTTWMAWDGASRLVPEQATVLRRAAILNAVVALMVLALLIVRLVG